MKVCLGTKISQRKRQGIRSHLRWRSELPSEGVSRHRERLRLSAIVEPPSDDRWIAELDAKNVVERVEIEEGGLRQDS